MNINIVLLVKMILITGLGILSFSANSDSQFKMSKQKECPQKENCKQQHDPEKHMINILSLRDEQLDSVLKVLRSSHEKRKQIHYSQREKHQSLHQEVLQQLKPLLDKQQMDRFISFAESMKMRHQRQMKGKRENNQQKNKQRDQ